MAVPPRGSDRTKAWPDDAENDGYGWSRDRYSTPTKARLGNPLTRDEYRWLPGPLALVPLHWAATAGLVDDGISEVETAMTTAEAWWSRRAELSS